MAGRNVYRRRIVRFKKEIVILSKYLDVDYNKR